MRVFCYNHTMPELPEVETSRRGISPHLLHKTIRKIIVRNRALRWPVPKNLNSLFKQQTINQIQRRGKYLILDTHAGSLIIHLGMSGSLRIVSASTPLKKHDHVDIVCTDGTCLRFNDPRRFGCVLYTRTDPLQHKLLQQLGPEPLSNTFNAAYLQGQCANKTTAIKLLIMNSKIVVGVGNIYANEALFMAKIDPRKPAKNLSKSQCQQLVRAIKQVLRQAIKAGGTTLQDFSQSDGKPGYFKQQLQVYDKLNGNCPLCNAPLQQIKLAGRRTVYCQHCQS